MASSTLYAPIVNSYEPGFLYWEDCRVHFKLSDYNSINDEHPLTAHVSVSKASTNLNVINNTVDYCKTGIIINAPIFSDEEKDGLYYVSIPKSVIQDSDIGWDIGGIYKIQIRLSEVVYNPPEKNTVVDEVTYLNNNANNFSEWSTVVTVKATGGWDIQIPVFGNTVNPDLDITGSYTNEDPTENLYSIRIRIYKYNDLVEDSGIIYRNEFGALNTFYYKVKKELFGSYTCEVEGETTSKMIISSSWYFYANYVYFDGNDAFNEVHLYHNEENKGYEEEEGCIALKVKMGEDSYWGDEDYDEKTEDDSPGSDYEEPSQNDLIAIYFPDGPGAYAYILVYEDEEFLNTIISARMSIIKTTVSNMYRLVDTGIVTFGDDGPLWWGDIEQFNKEMDKCEIIETSECSRRDPNSLNIGDNYYYRIKNNINLNNSANKVSEEGKEDIYLWRLNIITEDGFNRSFYNLPNFTDEGEISDHYGIIFLFPPLDMFEEGDSDLLGMSNPEAINSIEDFIFDNPEDDEEKYFSSNRIIRIKRSSEENDFEDWEDLIQIDCRGYSGVDGGPYFEDLIAESGIWYKYGIQTVGWEDGIMKRTYISPIKAIKREFDHSYLVGEGGRQLKIAFNPTLSNLQKSFTDVITPTIGSKYPFITRVGSSDYYSFQLGGMISFNVDENHLFLPKDFAFGYYNSSRINLYDTTYERKFRDEVYKWLTDGKPKLFKSPTEGNKIVRLSNVTLTPEVSLSRLIYSFSCTATEIDEANIDTYRKYGIIPTISNEEPEYNGTLI